ncbi:hypothetical protein SAICODRAFT_71292 [Saitoella complicata NRRL Y-17804]|uniref:Uncharacterized protein n=1 Tax=Saitoella complicata (strain BCRC 22490 / CBS 7301 / JCM 7358 / NBRC 10748 / NRRL Y-17804) TaxID=698492 RepID=A0A0E9NF85_SAICN|nr:uncharacterized protein SAICODRAFT_71292 [Saitoella complicata NRRL Y-17804]ODQ52855.1 hypothetical protein SAICODRAFT_71292 [Saitoella complicata NRRL Y-17804]GAO48522.1 hypothetical protein G7K_2695-t1 [Saitoella complicata NRRL Y-17804]
MAVSWDAIQTLAIILGPTILPRVVAFYRSIQSAPASIRKPLPANVMPRIAILVASALVAILKALPVLQVENIFLTTGSRLQTPIDVITTRLRSLDLLTPFNEAILSKFNSFDGRLLYVAYGPDAFANCTFCRLDESMTYFFYILPALALAHLIHIAVIALATSVKPAKAFRANATVGAVGLALFEIYTFATFNFRANAVAANTGADITWKYWSVMRWRGLGMAALDVVLAVSIYMAATGCWNIGADDLAERLETAAARAESTLHKTRAAALVRVAVGLNTNLRDVSTNAWRSQVEIRERLQEDEEVRAVKEEAGERLGITDLRNEAREYVDIVFDKVL